MADDVDAGVSRRTVLRRAAVLGGSVWVAPVVQSLASPAEAKDASKSPSSPAQTAPGSPRPGSGFSYVALLIKDGNTRKLHRMKFEFAEGGVQTLSFGRTFNTGLCPTADGDYLDRYDTRYQTGDPTLGTNPPVISWGLLPDRTWRLILNKKAVILDFVVHQGECCIQKATTPSSAYPVLPSVVTGQPNQQAWTFPAAPNKPPCSLA